MDIKGDEEAFRWIFRLVQSARGITIHEICVDADGRVRTFTENPVFLEGDSVDELHCYCSQTMTAFLHPVIPFNLLQSSARIPLCLVI